MLLSACGTPPDGSVPGARKTGTFPNLNIKPEVAAQQITPSEKTTKFAELKSAQTRQTGSAGAGVPPSDAAKLKKLADTHAADTLKQIEAE
ncbi:hypothetical protein ABFT80_16525 [Mesorhizobium sp. SB112]|uniref:hypothetical protein n=1 Tax=Mesorhizobium sp. SB112 TaxID=3151853 RepID=UPI003267F829